MERMDTTRNNLTLNIRLLLAGIISAPLATTVAQEITSPFAGTGETKALTSETLQWQSPIYEQPSAAATVRAAAVSAGSLGSAALVSQAVANQLQNTLPVGITLRVDQGAASLVSIGYSDSPGVEPLPEDIDPEQAQELNEQVDSEQLQELGVGRTAAAPVQKWIVNYPVAFQNIPVAHYADVTAFMLADGSIQFMRKRNLPNTIDSTVPEVTAESAREMAVANAGDWANDADVSEPQTEVWVNPDGSGRLTYRIDISSNDLSNPNARRYWIAAVGTPAIIFWESLVRHTHNGQVTGTIWTESGLPNSPTANQEFEKFLVNRSTGGTAVTGANGLFAFSAPGGNATLKSSLNDSHTNVKIDNKAGGEMARSKSGTPTNPIDLTFDASGETELAQTSGFYWVNKTIELASPILAPTDLPSLPTNVNINGQCNAFWNGSSVNFFKSGGGCPNMAYADVAAHEVGHGIDARKGGIANGGLSEGFGDAMAILVTRQSCVGRDFFGPGTCLREASDVIVWPPGPNEGVHAQGRRYAGFSYELIEQLKNTYSEDGAYAIATQLILAAAKANPADIPDAVKLSFIADDDDGDLSNGTPHFKELAAAADSRKIPRPADPIKGVRRIGFAWASKPTTASYTPSTTYAYNSAGGPITAKRSGVGQYSMTFSGLGGQGKAGGNVQVTSYGSNSNFCKAYWWSSSGADFTASVRCFKATGAPVDDRYTILVTWP